MLNSHNVVIIFRDELSQFYINYENKLWMPTDVWLWNHHFFTFSLLFMHVIYIGGTSINHTSFDGRTALLIAAEQGHVEAMKVLLTHNANPNIGDAMHNYPILAGAYTMSMQFILLTSVFCQYYLQNHLQNTFCQCWYTQWIKPQWLICTSVVLFNLYYCNII